MQYNSLHALIHRINLNSRALARATDDIGDWIDNIDSATISTRITEHLELIEKNAEVIATAMTEMAITGTPRTK